MSDDNDAIRAAMARYDRAAHAVQAGVKMEIQLAGEKEAGATPALLRSGLNNVMSEFAGVCALLIAKNVITPAEMWEALAQGVEAERTRYEQRLTERMGAEVKLHGAE